ncbi:uncharacterized protein LOC134675090 [Cydia fagiglandana]|uniref:uncharacterized protein LOC134675090 n=1 Tax=Cydia fagiglandana TaxID=1458189 RepID=UPI002FEE283F
MVDNKPLIRRRASLKAKLTLFESHLTTVESCDRLSRLQLTELNDRLSKIEEIYSEFDSVQCDIENELEIPDEQYKERDAFESKYFGLVARARELLSAAAPAPAPGASAGSDRSETGSCVTAIGGGTKLKLPTIDMPSFSGHYHDWLEFRDTFSSLIHSNNSIPNINKFHYLRAALKGSAAVIIQSLDFSSDNYTLAWELLCDRYNNKRSLVNNHIQAIFNIEQLSKESSRSIRNLIDTINKNLRALKSLDLPTEHWDVLIIQIISSKLDTTTHHKWESYRNKLKELPTLKMFNDFLKDRADLLESTEMSNKKRRSSDTTHNRQKALTATTYSPTTSRKYACPFCNDDHALYLCQKFKSLKLQARVDKAKALKVCLNCLRVGHNEKTCRLNPCRTCGVQRNSLLHEHTTPASSPSSNDVALHSLPQPDDEEQFSSPVQEISMSAVQNDRMLLSTVLIQVTDHSGKKHTIRALLDNGSTASYITESLRAKLNLPTSSAPTTVEGLNYQTSNLSKSCDVLMSSLINDYQLKVPCYVASRITQPLPVSRIDRTTLNIPPHIRLADPTFDVPAPVDMLLSLGIFWSVLGTHKVPLGKNKPTLWETKLGYLVTVPTEQYSPSNLNTVHCNHNINLHLQHYDKQLNDQLSQFFELESVATRKQISKEEQECEQSFINNTTRLPDGRFEVTIPLKETPEKLGDSYERALSRFISLERRFKREPHFKEQYCKFIKEYIALNHMSLNENPENDTQSYLFAHHGILRESLSTKLRVVFDGSMATTSGVSFNQIQLIGPTVQDDLISILIRMRQHKFIVTADVEKMYRMINVTPSQHSLQQILWRFEPYEQLQQYKLHTVTYGTASAPFLATRCLTQLGIECPDKKVSEVIQHDFYVDDLITGASSESDLINICKGVMTQLETGQFHLRKFNSNSAHIVTEIIGKSNGDELLNLCDNEYSKTLGLLWSSKEDNLLFSVNLVENNNVTKRTILSMMSQIFDPLGLVNPCVLLAKTILQKLWAAKISWDEPVPSDISILWSKFVSSLRTINNIRIPRCVVIDSPLSIELHTYSDASTQAYAACVYLRSVNNNNVSVHLVAAKSKVSPLKPVLTVPKLELAGALLAVRLANKVKSALRLKITSCTYWCDSTIVLGWIRSPKAHQLKPFVFNRVSEICDSTDPSDWRYVPTKCNPADIGSRGADANQLENCNLWWSGPPYLLQDEHSWPKQPLHLQDSDLPEFKVICNLNASHTDHTSYFTEFMKRFSNFGKLQRIIAYVHRFIYNCRNPQNKYTGYIKINELNLSLNSMCRFVQLEVFSSEYDLLKNKKQLSANNKLLQLNPFYNTTDKLLRVGGRLCNSFYDYDTKHPILLNSKHHLATLIVRHYHIMFLHAPPQLLLAILRHKFWLINGRNLARKIVENCIRCRRYAGKSIQPIMGNLPSPRLHTDYVFANTACDYAGPIMILNRRGRGSRLIKSYLCIFVCLAVKAVHIELVTDLSSNTFLAALDRFIARRGKPQNIFSDNGTCFTGACNELSKFLKSNSNYISSKASEMFINFKFSPAYSPHFNGLAEGSVKSVKYHLKRVLGLAHLTYEDLNSVLTCIEATLNSRPLTPLSSDPSDLTALTPAHFLIGRTLTMLPSPQSSDPAAIPTLSRYMRIQQLKAHFWSRYYTEYITELQKRQKWRKQGQQLQLGEMVLVKDDRLPPNRWLLGRVTRLYPGSDGVTRVADVNTTSGTLRRAFNRLCPLPVMDTNFVPGAATC